MFVLVIFSSSFILFAKKGEIDSLIVDTTFPSMSFVIVDTDRPGILRITIITLKEAVDSNFSVDIMILFDPGCPAFYINVRDILEPDLYSTFLAIIPVMRWGLRLFKL